MAKVLVVPDLHAPFIKEGFLEFCKEKKKKYRCNEVVIIGDVVDNCAASFHQSDPNGYGAGEELERAIEQLKPWYKAFPNAKVCIGNHDRIIARKAFDGGVPSVWIKHYNDVLSTPRWEWAERFEIDNVIYCHGDGPKAHIRAQREFKSVVQGHHHTVAYVQHFAGADKRLFAVQVGVGFDHTAYAFQYAKYHPRPFVSCAVIDGGEIATIYPARLEGGTL